MQIYTHAFNNESYIPCLDIFIFPYIYFHLSPYILPYQQSIYLSNSPSDTPLWTMLMCYAYYSIKFMFI